MTLRMTGRGGRAEENFQRPSAFGPSLPVIAQLQHRPPVHCTCCVCPAPAHTPFSLSLDSSFYHTVTTEGSVLMVAIIALILNLDSIITLHREDPLPK